jgi:hypothetical protein
MVTAVAFTASWIHLDFAASALPFASAVIAACSAFFASAMAVCTADGALAQKLKAWLEAQQYWADAFSKYQGSIVPQIQSGGATSGSGNGATNFMEIMGMKAARDLGLDMTMPKGATSR